MFTGGSGKVVEQGERFIPITKETLVRLNRTKIGVGNILPTMKQTILASRTVTTEDDSEIGAGEYKFM